MTVTADPTARQQPPATYQGSDDLLGRGLQFQVQGTGDAGQAGTPSARSACVYSWTAAGGRRAEHPGQLAAADRGQRGHDRRRRSP